MTSRRQCLVEEADALFPSTTPSAPSAEPEQAVRPFLKGKQHYTIEHGHDGRWLLTVRKGGALTSAEFAALGAANRARQSLTDGGLVGLVVQP